MKIINKIKIAFLIPAVIGMTSCVDETINVDPNTNPNMDPAMQISTIQVLQSNDAEAWHRYFIYPGGFMNQWTNDWAVVEYGGKGKKNDSYFAQLWDSNYPSVIKNVVDLVERTRDKPEYVNAHAAGRILKVENFLRLTDYYGDIPYFEAGMGYYTGKFKPAYDKQEDIYMDFFKELKEAAAMFDKSKDNISQGDLYYSGDLNKWKKFANSLRLRIAMRLINVDPAMAKAEAEAAVKDGVFSSNSDICYVMHDKVIDNLPSSGNGLANRFNYGQASTFRISNEAISVMERTNDPRLLLYAGSYLNDKDKTDVTELLYEEYGKYSTFALKAELFSYEDAAVNPGMKNEVTLILANEDTLKVEKLYQFMQPSKLLQNPASPFIHMSYAEVELLLAEAAYRGYNVGGTVASHFENALRASAEQWSLFGSTPKADDIDKFVAANQLNAGLELQQIATQLWILHILDPFETWANYRRLGLPEEAKFKNNYPKENDSNGETPRRMQYPIAEQTANPEGYKSAVDRLESKTDSWMDRVWWDTKK